jgi:catechol-2,3-dioxygenase
MERRAQSERVRKVLTRKAHRPKQPVSLEKISAVTLRVANMEAPVRFYKDVLGPEIIYGGEGSLSISVNS